ncbi:MAG: tRNA (adenosine(37)-N6)-threonylcarbamoyltransferase complex transferase subunit TsaD [Candidatus Pacebacteria bacterium]|nr:tRNA (adenosine(37)-N6)-threonylcarbamoyltransferase complex transferase subunit TsaD [Candidatus Paceibacterota bacterium]
MIILSIETSCDETAAAIVRIKGGKVEVLADIVSSQIKMHSEYGGVVPQLAARAHLRNMVPVLEKAFKKAKISKDELDYIAVTKGPGLIPALMIGVNSAKALAFILNKPIVEVNHLEGHIYANWLSKEKLDLYVLKKMKFPVLCLIVSGGHTQLVLMKKNMRFDIVGETVDDAVGEAFDKVAKILGLGYPGGPMVEKLAKSGDDGKIFLPRPMLRSGNLNFSFSGLKTAVLYETRKAENINEKYRADICASFQSAVIEVLTAKTIAAAKKYKAKNIFLGGGVSANKALCKGLKNGIKKNLPGVEFSFPEFKFTTDNALMIAIAGYYHIKDKDIGDWRDLSPDMNFRLR